MYAILPVYGWLGKSLLYCTSNRPIWYNMYIGHVRLKCANVWHLTIFRYILNQNYELCVCSANLSFYLHECEESQASPCFIFSWVLWMQKKEHERIWTRHDATFLFSRISMPTEVIPRFFRRVKLWRPKWPLNTTTSDGCDLFSMKWRSPKVLVEKLYAAKASAKKVCFFLFSARKVETKCEVTSGTKSWLIT